MEKLIKYKQDNKIGYKDDEGNVVISPLFDDGISFWEMDCPYTTVVKGGLCGIINQNGETIIPFEYEEACHLFDNYFAVRKSTIDGSWLYGVVDENQNIIIPFEYKLIRHKGRFIQCYKESQSKNSNSWFQKGNVRYDYWQEKDEAIWYNDSIIAIYEGKGVKSEEGFLVIDEDNKLGVIDSKGDIVIHCLYNELYCVSCDRFVVRLDNNRDWTFGVLDNNERIIIDFMFKYISHESAYFFDCYKSCNYVRDNNFWNPCYKYENREGEVWFNHFGKMVFEGAGKVLSEQLLAITQNDKRSNIGWGVINQECKMVVDLNYNRICIIQDIIIIEIDGNVGLVTESGNIIIKPIYNEIECVAPNNNTHKTYVSFNYYENYYGQYCKENVFDTSDFGKKLYRKRICWRDSCVEIKGESEFDFEKPFILKTYNCLQKDIKDNDYAEIFTFKNGLLPNSRFNRIEFLNNTCFAVMENGKWGVFSIDGRDLTIPCEYDCIRYEGGRAIFLNKDGLWGAVDIEKDSLLINIPIEYKEIKALDDHQYIFGVKIEKKEQMPIKHTCFSCGFEFYGGMEYCPVCFKKQDESDDYSDITYDDYTIVTSDGKAFLRMDRLSHLESQFIFYKRDRILTSRGGKYGFISGNGYVTVPFKYDFIRQREDGMFNVVIGEACGVIDLSGREIVNVKYSNWPTLKNNLEVIKDAYHDKFGVINKNGIEVAPVIYDDLLIDNKVIFFCYGDNDLWVDNKGNTEIRTDEENARIGCLDLNGNVLIREAYNCFKTQGDYLLAGYNGHSIGDLQGDSVYNGVYSLYNIEGKRLISGFNKFQEKGSLLLFHFGGRWKAEWKRDRDEEWGWESDSYCEISFEEGNGRWLITNKDLVSLIKKKDGSLFNAKGDVCTIKKVEKDGIITNYWNFPLEVFSVDYPIIQDGFAIIGDGKKKQILRLSNSKTSAYYDEISLIDNELFFICDVDRKEKSYSVGISMFDKEIIKISERYRVLTIPVRGFAFALKRISKEDFQVCFFDLNQPDETPVVAIENIKKNVLIEYLRDDKLEIVFDEKNEQLCSYDTDIFDKVFLQKVKLTTCKIGLIRHYKYWYSHSKDWEFRFVEYDVDNFRNGGSNDYTDYLGDTWDAMTDGMYGDMPDGFDGDYDFLGR